MEEKKSLVGREKAEEIDMPWFGMFDRSGPEGVFWGVCITVGSGQLSCMNDY